MKPLRLIPAVAFALIMIPGSARAVLVNVAVTGEVDTVDTELSSSFSPGDALLLNFSYESDTAPLGFSNNLFAVFNALTGLSFSTTSYAGGSTSAAPEIQIDNNPGFGFHDRFGTVSRASEGLTGPDVNGYTLSSFGFRLDDSTDAVFSTALVLPTVLNFADFDSGQFFIFFTNGEGFFPLVSGSVTSVTSEAVPEPASLVLLTPALFGAALARRNRKIL